METNSVFVLEICFVQLALVFVFLSRNTSFIHNDQQSINEKKKGENEMKNMMIIIIDRMIYHLIGNENTRQTDITV